MKILLGRAYNTDNLSPILHLSREDPELTALFSFLASQPLLLRIFIPWAIACGWQMSWGEVPLNMGLTFTFSCLPDLDLYFLDALIGSSELRLCLLSLMRLTRYCLASLCVSYYLMLVLLVSACPFSLWATAYESGEGNHECRVLLSSFPFFEFWLRSPGCLGSSLLIFKELFFVFDF